MKAVSVGSDDGNMAVSIASSYRSSGEKRMKNVLNPKLQGDRTNAGRLNAAGGTADIYDIGNGKIFKRFHENQ